IPATHRAEIEWPDLVYHGFPATSAGMTIYIAYSNKLDTDSSRLVRPIASPSREAIGVTRILRAIFTASVGWIESVITSSFSLDDVTRVTAPPDNTPWVI